ncbi:MAG: enoyl-CoA hydratase-related protein, partial [Flavobacteriales bacterium]|nr:enoyl-CoA hydratase-related protein [Flavobacteriales bacterium]
MTHSLIHQDKKARICTLTIQRPESLNALNAEVIRQLADAIQTAQTDTEVGIIILTGSGDKAFVAGADIKEFADFDAEKGRH